MTVQFDDLDLGTPTIEPFAKHRIFLKNLISGKFLGDLLDLPKAI